MSTIARFSLAEYDRIVESGAFDQRRLELIRGEIREMTPIGPEHEDVLDQLNVWSVERVSPQKARVRVQQSIGLPELDCAPEPDIAWVAPRRYSTGRPQAADVFLIIEVADSSLAYDRGDKAAMYAQAGIGDYWIVNLRDHVVEVHRDPQPNGYRDVSVYHNQDEVRPLAFPDVILRPSSLWA
ncbi:MAG: Uma2 family endonuclease [Planctomycetaceae bacterium]|mgnify:CR=1 FL=1|nr:Uma2 family endonuclease [Planctomycetaceae bacterium]